MTIRYEATEPARSSPFPPSVRLGERETGVLFSVLDRVARVVSHSEAVGPAGARVAEAGAAFRMRLLGGSPAFPTNGLAEAAATLPSPLVPPAAGAMAPELGAPLVAGGPAVNIPYDAALDLAAELLEVADVLLDAGSSMEALALEGVSGRLLELVVDAGPYEGTPIGVRR